jgi:hypothetical protein
VDFIDGMKVVGCCSMELDCNNETDCGTLSSLAFALFLLVNNIWLLIL